MNVQLWPLRSLSACLSVAVRGCGAWRGRSRRTAPREARREAPLKLDYSEYKNTFFLTINYIFEKKGGKNMFFEIFLILFFLSFVCLALLRLDARLKKISDDLRILINVILSKNKRP